MAALVLLACTLLAITEIIRRYVFGVSFYWQQDAVTFFILSAVYLVFCISQRHGAHLNVTAFLGLLEHRGPGARRAGGVIKFLATLISLVFLVAVVWWGIPEAHDSQRFNTRTESLLLPLWPFLWVLLAGFALMAVSLVFQVYSGIQKLIGRDGLEEPAGARGALH
ncbi:MAG: TRAP transporter small permease [Thermodesulfobacteriota bacterium]|nr:TRAP transporter small permease [Thermodesulfobacteriota bacterium]